MIKPEDIIYIERPDLNVREKAFLWEIFRGMGVTLHHMVKTVLSRFSRVVYYPDATVPQLIQNYRGMHRLNRDADGRVACVACFMCGTACPADCIHIEAGEAPWDDREKYPVKFEIDELRCIYCGMCEEACPVDAIELTPEYKILGLSREEMIFDKEKLLKMYDETVELKPRKDPRITGYPNTGRQEGQE